MVFAPTCSAGGHNMLYGAVDSGEGWGGLAAGSRVRLRAPGLSWHLRTGTVQEVREVEWRGQAIGHAVLVMVGDSGRVVVALPDMCEPLPRPYWLGVE